MGWELKPSKELFQSLRIHRAPGVSASCGFFQSGSGGRVGVGGGWDGGRGISHHVTKLAYCRPARSPEVTDLGSRERGRTCFQLLCRLRSHLQNLPRHGLGGSSLAVPEPPGQSWEKGEQGLGSAVSP